MNRLAAAPGERLAYSVKVPLPRARGSYRILGSLTTQPVRTASVPVTVN